MEQPIVSKGIQTLWGLETRGIILEQHSAAAIGYFDSENTDN
jgi:hypothetical protein